MGEYLDPGSEQFLGAGEGLGRHVALYYGSFVNVGEGDPEFDWEEEMWETLTHELRHHVESLAGDDSLNIEDEVVARDFERRDDDDRPSERRAWRWPWQRAASTSWARPRAWREAREASTWPFASRSRQPTQGGRRLTELSRKERHRRRGPRIPAHRPRQRRRARLSRGVRLRRRQLGPRLRRPLSAAPSAFAQRSRHPT
jgi:hypothetical protein